ncbi:MAG: hypothetical protein PUA75_01315 [Clostridiales bacterium]|nr:hypothetical protein [Clostridiales bacterium]
MATIFSTAYAGTGVSLSSSYYLRRFYSANTDAKTSASRKQYSNTALSNADARALRRAIKSLGSFTYDDDSSTNIRNSVSAFIDTYNNLLDSSGSSEDRRMQQTYKSMKKLTSEYADELDKIGITVSKDGTLKKRTDLFANADISKFEKLFSKDTDYMQRISAYTRRVQKRSETLDIEEKRAALLKQQQQNTSTLAATTFTTSSGIPAAGTGNNVNVVL